MLQLRWHYLIHISVELCHQKKFAFTVLAAIHFLGYVVRSVGGYNL